MTLKNIDIRLIDNARQGNRDALEELLALAQPDIRQYAKQHCLISDVDDAVQEVLLTMTRKLDSLRVVAAFSSWLFKSTQRECRRLGRVTLNFDPFDEAMLEAWLGSAPTSELLIELIDTMDRLPSDYREVLLLKDFQQLTNKEISKLLGISIAAVKSRLHRARQMARSLLLGIDYADAVSV